MDLTEEERLDSLKKWWKDNSRSAFAGVSLGIAIMLGWNAWQGAKLRKAEEAATTYQQMLKAVETKQGDSAGKLAERLIEKYQGSIYATYGALFLAKQKADAGDFATAQKTLRDLLASTGDDKLRHLIRLRLARVLQAQGDANGALQVLDSVKAGETGEFDGLYEMARGDLYVDLKRPADAQAAYQRARGAGQDSPLLELKLNDLGAAAPAPAAP